MARRRPKAEHTWYKVVMRAVFHAPMFALNADATVNACEPNRTRSTPTERARTFRCGYVGAETHNHTRAHTHGRTREHRRT